MRIVPAFGFRAALVLLPLLAACPAGAEHVTYHLTGTVTSVTDGSPGTLDLRPTFTNGAAFTVDVTVERSTPYNTSDNIAYLYLNPGTALSCTIGSYVCTGALANVIGVFNDNPIGAGLFLDDFVYQASVLVGPQVSTATSSNLAVELGDYDATAFSSGALPRPMPALSNFENATLTLQFSDDAAQNVGVVVGTFDGLTTPARATSWGRIKADYR